MAAEATPGWSDAYAAIHAIVETDVETAAKARRSAAVIRAVGDYRWVGVYAVTDTEIGILGWSGPGAPAHPRFPITDGLSGVAVDTKATVVVDDVATDPRYLTAFDSTRAEIVVPIVAALSGHVLGTVDVESERRAAFTPADREALQRCASLLTPMYAAADLGAISSTGPRRHRST